MSYADDLLAQARTLSRQEPRRPRQASLRRAVSAAYYAAFHLLCDAVARELVNGPREKERDAVRRSISHQQLKSCCGGFRAWYGALPADLERTLALFEGLQQARHAADYALHTPLRRGEALLYVEQAAGLLAAWSRVKADPAARAFLVYVVARGGTTRQ